ncbi:PEMT [Bugula neritina]|uniref:Phosphatidylethanolamine N-methyltransferase n=1 Tax=Bugula neritina TaxID=10212 RepID=A0A7J7JL77_BUGNE|nr:PEMT [Bugula neritina]
MICFTVALKVVADICKIEYHTQVFSKAFGSPKLACFTLSLLQILSSNCRNYYIKETMVNQKHFETPYNDLLVIVEYCIVAVGGLLVVTAFFRLGWFGTWHGDHFGLLLDEKVTAFPYNVVEHPMHVGGTLNFLGLALGTRSLVGLLLTMWVKGVYYVTELVEGPFTEMIYAKAAGSKKKKN